MATAINDPLAAFSALIAFSALTRLVGRQEGHLACKKWDGCKGVLLIVIRCNEVTNFLIPSAGN